MKVATSVRHKLIEEGWFDATIVDKKKTTPVSTSMGKRQREEFSFELLDGIIIKQNVLIYYSQGGTNLLSRMFSAAFKKLPDEIDTDDLIGKDVVVELKHNRKGNSTYVNVVDCLSEDDFDDEPEIEDKPKIEEDNDSSDKELQSEIEEPQRSKSWGRFPDRKETIQKIRENRKKKENDTFSPNISFEDYHSEDTDYEISMPFELVDIDEFIDGPPDDEYY